MARWFQRRHREASSQAGIPSWALEALDGDPEDPDLVSAWISVGLSERLGRPGLTAARLMPPEDLIRSLLLLEAFRGMDRFQAMQRRALAALRGAQ